MQNQVLHGEFQLPSRGRQRHVARFDGVAVLLHHLSPPNPPALLFAAEDEIGQSILFLPSQCIRNLNSIGRPGSTARQWQGRGSAPCAGLPTRAGAPTTPEPGGSWAAGWPPSRRRPAGRFGAPGRVCKKNKKKAATAPNKPSNTFLALAISPLSVHVQNSFAALLSGVQRFEQRLQRLQGK